MKILVLGSSGSDGTGLPDRAKAWAPLLRDELEARSGEPVAMEHIRYYTWTENWRDYLESALAKGPYDLVVLSPTKFAFSIKAVDNRVRRLAGKRAGDWFKRNADSFDAKTRKAGDEGPRRKANRFAHRVARRLIGQEPLADVRIIAQTYIETMARLARLEDTQVILIGTSDNSTQVSTRNPAADSAVRYFRDALREEAVRRRFDWVDREALLLDGGRDRDLMYVDGVHKTEDAHRRLALALADCVIPAATTT